MTNIAIPDELYKEWVELYEKQDKLVYPSIKQFTALRLKEIIKKENKKISSSEQNTGQQSNNN